ncbi:MAG: DUF4373 domain-containing protein [Muribaculaceae bacterium]|nr:DUF4373 domain-containing protein [Muribaculaceae bacterium]
MAHARIRNRILPRKDSRVIDLLIAHGHAGYGVYVMLCEYLSEKGAFTDVNDYKRIAYILHVDADLVKSVMIDFGLFEAPAADVEPKSDETTNAEAVTLSEAKKDVTEQVRKTQLPRRRRKRPWKIAKRVVTRFELEWRKTREELKPNRFYYGQPQASKPICAPGKCSRARRFYVNGKVTYRPVA